MFAYKEILMPQSKYSVKCPYAMTPQFIVVHNTANDASAENEVKYMEGNDKLISFHYAIDDKYVIKAIPEWRNAFHANDGKNGKGNRYGLSVEICYSKSGGERFLKAEENAAEFIAELLEKYGWDISKVKKHQDFSGKYCPHRTLDMGWDRFLNIIKKYMKEDEEMTNEERVKFNEIVNIVGNLTHKIEAIEAENTILKKAIGWNSENKDEPALYAYNDDNIRKFVAEDGNEVIGRLIKDRRLSVDESGAFAPLSKTALRLLIIQNR